MLDFARLRAIEALKSTRRAFLATNGPAGIQAGEYPCEAIDLVLYMLVPQTSDHLFNLEFEPNVSLVAEGWELKGLAHVIQSPAPELALKFLREPGAEWCALLQIKPYRIQIQRDGGWGNHETIDIESKN